MGAIPEDSTCSPVGPPGRIRAPTPKSFSITSVNRFGEEIIRHAT
jgi:hypothetical protein